MGFMSFEDLEVWKKSCKLCVDIFKYAERIDNYGLKDQMTRSILSVASNIAEGCDRDSNKDFIRFLRIAKGSAAECRTQLYIAFSLNYINKNEFDDFLNELKSISSMLYGLIKSIQRRDENE